VLVQSHAWPEKRKAIQHNAPCRTLGRAPAEDSAALQGTCAGSADQGRPPPGHRQQAVRQRARRSKPESPGSGMARKGSAWSPIGRPEQPNQKPRLPSPKAGGELGPSRSPQRARHQRWGPAAKLWIRADALIQPLQDAGVGAGKPLQLQSWLVQSKRTHQKQWSPAERLPRGGGSRGKAASNS